MGIHCELLFGLAIAAQAKAFLGAPYILANSPRTRLAVHYLLNNLVVSDLHSYVTMDANWLDLRNLFLAQGCVCLIVWWCCQVSKRGQQRTLTSTSLVE
jgi:hypothetical protein